MAQTADDYDDWPASVPVLGVLARRATYRSLLLGVLLWLLAILQFFGFAVVGFFGLTLTMTVVLAVVGLPLLVTAAVLARLVGALYVWLLATLADVDVTFEPFGVGEATGWYPTLRAIVMDAGSYIFVGALWTAAIAAYLVIGFPLVLLCFALVLLVAPVVSLLAGVPLPIGPESFVVDTPIEFLPLVLAGLLLLVPTIWGVVLAVQGTTLLLQRLLEADIVG